jgi:hypothetical protein
MGVLGAVCGWSEVMRLVEPEEAQVAGMKELIEEIMS